MLNGGSCGCSIAAPLGFPQTGGQMNARNSNSNSNSNAKKNNVGRQLNGVYNSINVSAPKFGGGMFDWLLGKKPEPAAMQSMPQHRNSEVPHSTNIVRVATPHVNEMHHGETPLVRNAVLPKQTQQLQPSVGIFAGGKKRRSKLSRKRKLSLRKRK